jgi:rare lipoprotein A
MTAPAALIRVRLTAGPSCSVPWLPILLILLVSSISGCASSRRTVSTDSRTVVASWYGKEFHGRPTASGERFDMHAFTCAHRDFPFGTRLRVTNVSDSRTVICTVNDRGPFVTGRDLDLSYASARDLGLLAVGTGPVRMEPLDRDERYVREVRASPSPAQGVFTIQVGSFREQEHALRLKEGLDFRYRGVYVSVAIIDGVAFHRVRVGRYLGKSDALKAARALADEGYSVLVTSLEERR